MSVWKKTMRPYMDKYFEIIISENEFNKQGYIPESEKINLSTESEKYHFDIHICPNCEIKML